MFNVRDSLVSFADIEVVVNLESVDASTHFSGTVSQQPATSAYKVFNVRDSLVSFADIEVVVNLESVDASTHFSGTVSQQPATSVSL